MKSYRNKEGYHDPTAGEAIEKTKKKKSRAQSKPLMYRVGNIPKFEAIKAVVR